jgi:transcriptional regulator with XRE-family HTH domain
MNKLRELRIKKGLTLEQLAGLAGLNKDTLSRLEKGRKAMPVTVGKLSGALGVAVSELEELIEGENKEQSYKPSQAELQELKRRIELSKAEDEQGIITTHAEVKKMVAEILANRYPSQV